MSSEPKSGQLVSRPNGGFAVYVDPTNTPGHPPSLHIGDVRRRAVDNPQAAGGEGWEAVEASDASFAFTPSRKWFRTPEDAALELLDAWATAQPLN